MARRGRGPTARSATALPCGACSLIPTPLAVVPFATGPRGDAALKTALSDPSLVGQRLLAQWLVAGPGGCGSVALSFSNALEVTTE